MNQIKKRYQMVPLFTFIAIFILYAGSLSNHTDQDISIVDYESSKFILIQEFERPPSNAEKGTTRNNGAPQLFWTLEENYETNGVHPINGISTDDYIFKISYTDTDNDDPRAGGNFIYLVLNGVNHSLTCVDENFVDGSIFQTTINGLNPMDHEYYFLCFDGNYTVRFPSENASLPVINSRPELIIPYLNPSGGNIYSGSVFPNFANATDPITFQVIYLDIDNHPPSSGLGSRGVVLDNVYHKMNPQEGQGFYYDGIYSNGEMFEISFQVNVGDDHSHYFEFTDSMGATNYSTPIQGPVIVEGFPDLRIGRDYERRPLITGQPNSDNHTEWWNITISATIENPSEHSVNQPFLVKFDIYYADIISGEFSLVQAEEVTIAHLYHTQRNKINISFSALSVGIYKTTVTADSGFEITEIVDNNDTHTNNIASVQFQVGPDLVLENEKINPPSAFSGESVIMSATIFNNGRTTAYFDNSHPLIVEFTINNETFMDVISEPLEPGEHIISDMDYTYFSEGELILTVRVDRDNNVEEAGDLGSFNNNNVGFKKITFIEKRYDFKTPSFAPNLIWISLTMTLATIMKTLFSKKQKQDH